MKYKYYMKYADFYGDEVQEIEGTCLPDAVENWMRRWMSYHCEYDWVDDGVGVCVEVSNKPDRNYRPWRVMAEAAIDVRARLVEE